MNRIGEFNRREGTDLYGAYVRVSMGNVVDTWRQTGSGHWYRDSRESRNLPRCQVRDDEALRTLNAFEPGLTE